MSIFAVSVDQVVELVPLGTVLGFAALFFKRWWGQQDNAMAAAIEATNREVARCDERIARKNAEHEADLSREQERFDRLSGVVRELIPQAPPEMQARLWEAMWSAREPVSAAPPPTSGESDAPA